ncbi:glycosyltransferase [Tenacibaculum insulae]|uniref:glycosyltransferase n=1 Tax=Tenacibaculum insulae TaxID=2029677 RepID=UPI003AB51E8E
MKVSVLINNYNYGKFIGYAIRSVLKQKYKDLEIIVYDDGSTDDSLDVLKSFGNDIVLISEDNYGGKPSVNQANAIERAFSVSSGEIVFLLDSDDVFLENKINKVVSVFKEELEVVCVQHTFKLINEKGEGLKERKRPILSGVNLPEAMFFTGSFGYFFSQTSSLAFRRSFLEGFLPFDKANFLMQWPDIRLTRNAMYCGDVKTLQLDLGGYRVHGSNDSDKLKNKEYLRRFIEEHTLYLNSLSKKYINKKFKYKGRFTSVFLIFLLNLVSKKSIINKIKFYKNFLIRR